MPQDTKYYAISHVWGSKPPLIDVPTIPWKVPAAQGKVDFILNACAANKIDYIWFDIFCIRQGGRNDEAANKDKEREMPKMQQYYTKCVAGFVIGDAYDSFAARWLKVDTLLNTWNKDRDGTKPETLHDIWQGLGDIDAVVGGGKEDQWFWRLWTLQETVLPPYLLTSTGTVMQVYDFCNLIKWTYIALAKKILDRNGPAVYNWLDPGQGVVNYKQWYLVAHCLLLTRSFGQNLDPLQALVVTSCREYNKSDFPKDALYGAYGLIDAKWHIKDEKKYTLQDVWKLTVTKYIEKYDIAPLLSMAVIVDNDMTWAAGKTKFMGSVVVEAGRCINKTGIVSCYVIIIFFFSYTSTAKMDDIKLKLTVPGVSKIKLIPNYTHEYKDGSGELSRLLSDLLELEQAKYKISSINALLIRAIRWAGFECQDHDNLETLNHIITNHGIAQNNAISSGLREVFNGWYRFLVTTDSKDVFLAWCPVEMQELAEGNCSLLWSVPGPNEWAAIVIGELNSCRKLGIAFTNDFEPSPSTDQEVTLL